ncbi:MAG TPA: stage II sporulation protein M [Gaiellaceae bacterium]|nr:stage II sporulation protein M [Gaiellaceae bacterium]
MRLDRFITARSPDWHELELLLREAGRRPERLGPERLLRLGGLYRATAADLARLRRHAPRAPETARLETLVRQGRQAVYDARTRRRSIVRFFVTDYWRLIAERRKALLVAFVLLFGSAALAALWGVHDPAAATGVVPAQFRPALQPGHPWHDMSASQQAAFTSEVFTNNIQVTLVAFAGGMTGGIATALALLYNGLLLGVIGGLMGQAGNGVGFVDLVTAHGVLELSCILVGGAAGLSLGWSIIAPGLRTRRVSLQREAVQCLLLVVGTAPWLVVAGIVEGNRANLAESGLGAVIGTGAGLGLVFWGLVLWRGRVRDGPATSPAGTS